MSKVNKIIKYELENEVDPLLENGVALHRIANIIKESHPDIKDLQKISNMSIMRYRDYKEKKKLEEVVSEGENPIDAFNNEFKEAIMKLMEKNEKWDDRIETLWQESKDDATIVEKAKIIKEARDNRDQSKKEWTALAQYGIRQQSNIYNINMKKEQNINLKLMEYANKLCPKCRNEVSKLLIQEGDK